MLRSMQEGAQDIVQRLRIAWAQEHGVQLAGPPCQQIAQCCSVFAEISELGPTVNCFARPDVVEPAAAQSFSGAMHAEETYAGDLRGTDLKSQASNRDHPQAIQTR